MNLPGMVTKKEKQQENENGSRSLKMGGVTVT